MDGPMGWVGGMWMGGGVDVWVDRGVGDGWGSG